MRTKPIMPITMFRNIMGRVDGYRGVRILPVEGNVVGVPSGPTNQHAFRNLMSMALAFAADGKASLQVYFSQGVITSAFDPTQSEFKPEQYANSMFVTVRPVGGNVDGSDDKVCVNLLSIAGCPDFDGWDEMSLTFDTLDPQNVVIPVTWNGADVASITDDEGYELTEDVHYTVGEDSLTITTDYLLYNFGEVVEGAEPECRELTIVFDNECPEATITICAIAEGEADADTE